VLDELLASSRMPATPVADTRRDDWPHTSRVLPWMIAGFIWMLWLLPFGTISLTASLPFDLFLDRIVLPFIVLAWLVSLAAGGRNRPRVRLTPIHIAVGTYAAVSFLSVVVNTSWLNTELLFSTSLKQLILLSSYVIFFVIVASVVRPSEVRAFVKYSLILAVVCGVGVLWEYRFHTNFFYTWSHNLLPSGLFKAPLAPGGVDELGRPQVLGPASVGLEVASMLALAVPIALVGVMRSSSRRDQFLYALAACVLLAAGVATFKKSALVTPAVLIVLLAVFRPRAVLRLLPIGVALFIAVHLLAPGALGGVITQLTGGKLTTAGTTVHRTSSYSAVNPLVWARPVLGQGYGSYNANLLRIFDSQILTGLIETGIIGVLAYLSMMVTVLATARPLFRGRDGERAWLALALGVGASAFFVSSFLYDAMSFPHGPYLFLTFAAFVAVLAGGTGRRAGLLRSGAANAPV
jgi:hypothetical protein